MQVAEDLGYIKGKIEGIEGNVIEIKDRLEKGDGQFRKMYEDLNDHTNDPDAHHQDHVEPWYRNRRNQTGAGGGIAATIITILIALEKAGLL